MEGERLISVGAFAKVCGITLAMLRHYDKIGLLSPVLREENRYRYYSIRQMPEVNLIRTIQQLGMS